MRKKHLIKPIAGGSFDPLYHQREELTDTISILFICATLIAGMLFMFTLLLIKGIITL
jgi:hypothetical protein